MAFLKRRRRDRLRGQPFPAEWRRFIERNVPLFSRLPADDQAELLGHVQVLLAEKHFEGCGGLELTDEIRVTVAAQASALLLHRDTDYYPRLTSILIYPSTYVLPGERPIGGGMWEEREDPVLGHTSLNMQVLLLTWDATLGGARDIHDGTNVVFHEFAHQLDFEDSVVDGTPVLDSRARYASWARVLSADYAALRESEADGRETFLDQYGATNPAEFFAVVTEMFFERPHQFRRKHAALYEELRSFYKQDPSQWDNDDRGSPGTDM